MSAAAGDPPPPLRVTYLIPGLGTGGAERSLAELLEHGLKGAVEPSVICLHRRDEGVQHRVLERTGVAVRWLGTGGLVARARELRRILAEDPPDLLVTQVYDADIVGRVALLGRRRPPILSTLVNAQYDRVRVDEDPNVSLVGMRLAQAVDAITGRLRVDHYLAITEVVADHAVHALRVPRRRITVVPRGRRRAYLGEPSPQRRAAVRERIGVAGDAPMVLSVGRREYQKGQRHLLAAMPAVLERHPTAVLVVAGRDGNAAAALDRQVGELGIDEHVRFLGHDDDVPGLLVATDVFAFPSLWEGFGGSLAEAMGLGVAAVVSDLPVLREVLGEDGPATGVTVAPADPPALAGAISELLDDPERRRSLGDAARARFDEHFELEPVAEATLALYRQVAGGR